MIFNEAEMLTENLYVVEPEAGQVLMVKPKKHSGKRKEDLKNLPVDIICHTLSEEKLTELFGENGWKQLPDEVFKRVKVQPAVYSVEEHHVAVYAGKDNQTIVKADRPKSLLRNSVITPSLAASIINAKYVNGLPIYRIHQEFLRNNIHISRQVLANWMIQMAERYLGIVYDRLHEKLLNFHVLQADETPVSVSKDGRPGNAKSYMWIYRTGKYYRETPIILYDYQKTRSHEHPEAFLKGFQGLLVTDAFSAYEKMDRENPGIAFSACWAHARRRFTEALKALPPGKKEAAKSTIAHQALEKIAAIYHLDYNATEGALRSFCLHKLAWKIIDTIDGAKASAIIYSITETAKTNRLNPYQYLGYLFTELMEHQEDTDRLFLDNLLPWSDKLPEICKVNTSH